MNTTLVVDVDAVLTPATLRKIAVSTDNPFTRFGDFVQRSKRDVVLSESGVVRLEQTLADKGIEPWNIGAFSANYTNELFRAKGTIHSLSRQAERTYLKTLVDVLPENAFGRARGYVTPHAASILAAAVFGHDIAAHRVAIITRNVGVVNGVKFLNSAGFNFTIATVR